MSIYQVSRDTCIFVNPKAGSMSMLDALGKVPTTILEISSGDSRSFLNRVVFIRDPIERLNSLFNHFYWLSHHNSNYSEFMPAGTITAHGRRVNGFVGANEHHWTRVKSDFYDERVTSKRGEQAISDADLTAWLDNEDFKSMVDYILSGNNDIHWSNQVDLCSDDDGFIPNIVRKFEDLSVEWPNYVDGTIPHLNSWQPIAHDVYKLAELKAYYAKDLAKRREL